MDRIIRRKDKRIIFYLTYFYGLDIMGSKDKNMMMNEEGTIRRKIESLREFPRL